MEINFEIRSIVLEKGQAFLETLTNRWQPFSRAPRWNGRFPLAKSVVKCLPSMPRSRRSYTQSFADPPKNFVALVHRVCLPFQYSLNDCDAIGGNSRVLVQPRTGSSVRP